MKTTKWNQSELNYLIENIKYKSVKEISLELERSEKAVRNRLAILNISLVDVKNKNFKTWSKDEEKFLKENYFKYTVKELSEILQRKESSIMAKKFAKKLNNKYEKIKENGGKIYFRNQKEYYLYYDKRENKLIAYHRKIYEDNHNIKLKKENKIHHIDGDKKNNNINNLFLCENVSHHRKLHCQLQEISYQLIKEKYILFDEEKGLYIANPNRRLFKE